MVSNNKNGRVIFFPRAISIPRYLLSRRPFFSYTRGVLSRILFCMSAIFFFSRVHFSRPSRTRHTHGFRYCAGAATLLLFILSLARVREAFFSCDISLCAFIATPRLPKNKKPLSEGEYPRRFFFFFLHFFFPLFSLLSRVIHRECLRGFLLAGEGLYTFFQEKWALFFW